MVCGEVSNATLDESKVLCLRRRICVPQVGDLIKDMLVKAYGSHYSIHPGAKKMYYNLK